MTPNPVYEARVNAGKIKRQKQLYGPTTRMLTDPKTYEYSEAGAAQRRRAEEIRRIKMLERAEAARRRETLMRQAKTLEAMRERYTCVWPECTAFMAGFRNLHQPEPTLDPRYPGSPLCVEHLEVAWGLAQRGADAEGQDRFERGLREAIYLNSAVQHEWTDRPTALRKPTPSRPGTLYYLSCDGFIKVGYASHLANRLKQYPPSIKLLAARPGTRAEEASEHSLLQEYRAWRREWYHPVPPVLDHIDKVKDCWGEVPKTLSEEVAEMRAASDEAFG